MKRIVFKSFIFLAILMVFTTSALAFGSVRGQVIDSVEFDGWIYGGEVWVYDTITGAVCGTGVLDTSGNITGGGTIGIDIASPGNDDDLAYGSIANCTSGNPVEIYVDFNCSMNAANCMISGTPLRAPGTRTVQFNQNGLPIVFDAGYIETLTGPTALDLVEFTVSPQAGVNTWLPYVLLVGSVALVSGAITLVRRRRA